jgi:hypothetical protein
LKTTLGISKEDAFSVKKTSALKALKFKRKEREAQRASEKSLSPQYIVLPCKNSPTYGAFATPEFSGDRRKNDRFVDIFGPNTSLT